MVYTLIANQKEEVQFLHNLTINNEVLI